MFFMYIQENSEFKLHLKIDLVSHPNGVEGLGKYIQIYIHIYEFTYKI